MHYAFPAKVVVKSLKQQK